MKTSSKIILENIRIDKQLRINVALVNDKQLNTLFNDINHHIDEFNNKTFFKLYTTTNEKVRESERVKRLKSFLDIRKDVEDELPVPDDDEDDVPSIPPALKRKLNL